MKIFVSGQIKDLDYVREIQAKLVQAGHTITHDWTMSESDSMLATPQEKLRNVKETGNKASLNIQGVIDCDAFVICTDNQDQGKGMYAELGAALALNTASGHPRIFLVGPMNHMSVFYLHPAVVHANTIEEIIEQLKA